MRLDAPELKALGWPMCDVCKRPVHVLYTWFDQYRFAMGAWVVTAECHGKREEVTIDAGWIERMQEAIAGAVNFNGVAFKQKELAEGDKAK